MLWSTSSKYHTISQPPLQLQQRSYQSWAAQPVVMLATGALIGAFVASTAISAIAGLSTPRIDVDVEKSQDTSPADAQSFLPNFSTVEIPFAIDDTQWDNTTNWALDYPFGRGFIEVQNPHSHGLAYDKESDTTSYYLVSMFHAMHCLERLSEIMSDLVTGDAIVQSDPPLHHIGHCISYLKESVLCSGDLTLEHARKLKERPKQDITHNLDIKQRLSDATHVCKDRSEILEFLSSYGWAWAEKQQTQKQPS